MPGSSSATSPTRSSSNGASIASFSCALMLMRRSGVAPSVPWRWASRALLVILLRLLREALGVHLDRLIKRCSASISRRAWCVRCRRAVDVGLSSVMSGARRDPPSALALLKLHAFLVWRDGDDDVGEHDQRVGVDQMLRPVRRHEVHERDSDRIDEHHGA